MWRGKNREGWRGGGREGEQEGGCREGEMVGGQQGGGNGEGEMGRGQQEEGDGEGATGRGRWAQGAKGMGEVARGGGISQMDIEYLAEADRMPEATEAMAFTDSYKHIECLDGMRLQSF